MRIATPAALSIEGPGTLAIGECGAFTVKMKDGEAFEAHAQIDVPLRLRRDGMAAFTDAACTESLTTPQIASGESSMTFYLKGDAQKKATIGALAPKLTAVTMQLVVGGP